MQTTLRVLASMLIGGAVAKSLAAEPASFDALATEYAQTTKAVLKQFCLDCHSTADKEGELDLERFTTLASVRKDPQAWQKVQSMLASGEMPPEDSPQPSARQRMQLARWVQRYLDAELRANAGDPGPIVLRRLNNSEYKYTIRDLTGVRVLDPTREFPVDGGAGEGFTNTGAAQGMSPALIQKYLDAAKDVSRHVVLQPDGIRFSPHTTRRDHTDELLAAIRAFYARFTAPGGGNAVNLQGIKFETNQGGRLPVEKYLAATLDEREALAGGKKSIEQVARQRGLNARYLQSLWDVLTHEPNESSVLLESLRTKWRLAGATDVNRLAGEIEQAQGALWKFNSVGHIGMSNGPKRWMEARSTVTTSHELRFELPDSPGDVVIYLAASDLGDGNDQDFVVWQRPRIEFKAEENRPARPAILLRDVRGLSGRVAGTVAAESARTGQYLDALRELHARPASPAEAAAQREQAAKDRQLHPQLLKNWAAVVGLQRENPREIAGRLASKLTRVHGHESINGWGGAETSLMTNTSDQPISFLTLTVPARGVTVHPSPTLESRVVWRCPLAAEFLISGLVADADNKCGNGAAWRLEVSTAAETSVPAQGVIDNGKREPFQLDTNVALKAGDLVVLIVNPRDGSHICDTTHVELKLSEVGGKARVWDLGADIVDHVLKGNPLPDSHGNPDVWHFCATQIKPESKPALASGTALARWRSAVLAAKPVDEIAELATKVERLLSASADADLSEADKSLRRQLLDWNGPLNWLAVGNTNHAGPPSRDGVDPARFGKHPNGGELEVGDLCLQAPHLLEVRLPASLVAGGELVTTCRLAAAPDQRDTGGSVQAQILAHKPESITASPAAPILITQGSSAQRRVETAVAEFRDLFPPALCYTRIVPVDEVVTLQLFYREDDHLRRLMLDPAQTAELDRLWAELFFVSREPIALAGVYEQLAEFATQDNPEGVKALAPLKKPIHDRADKFRQRLQATEPVHVGAVLEFADRAWRRPLSNAEREDLRQLYRRLRESDLAHEEAVRLLIARVLTSPGFLYKLEQPAPGKAAAPVSDAELATRLSYFLWSSLPDAELRGAAADGRLATNDKQGSPELLAQTRRMLAAPQTRRLAIEFACQWLHVRDFDTNDDKNEKRYPEFAGLRDDMYEETVRFFADLFRHDRSILTMLDADHTFLNPALARHYGIGGVSTDDWQRVANVRASGRGGVLAMATILASQSGASRTSPILRGNWVYETLLGERLPRPPANVPQLPETVPSGLTERQLIEQHSSVAACAKCHARIDPYGFALEQYDAIGRLRAQKVDTRTTLASGKTIEGIDGLRAYLLTERRDDFVRQFCRKLLGYALGREVQLSDELLLSEMQVRLKQHDYRFRVAVEAIVTSPQFRDIRGLSFDP